MYYQELYFLENILTKETLFLYGLCIEGDYEEYPGKNQKIKIKDSTIESKLILLIIKQVISENKILNELQKSEKFTYVIHNTEISVFLKKRPSILQMPKYTIDEWWINRKFIPPESFTHTITKVISFQSNDKITRMLSFIDPKGNLKYQGVQTIFKNLIKELEYNTGLSFSDAYASRIGNYEHFSLVLNSGEIAIDTIRTEPDKSNNNRIYAEGIIIKRFGLPLKTNVTANVVLKGPLDILIDKIVYLKKGVKAVPIRAQEPVSSYEVKLYNEENDLIFNDVASIFSGIISVRNVNSLEIIENRLHKKEKRVGILQQEKQKGVDTQQSYLSYYHYNQLNRDALQMKCFINDILEKSKNSRWFNSGALAGTECFSYLKNLISKKENKEVLIIDPAFSAAACKTFIPAIENHRVKYTIITCVHSWNPDTDKVSTLEKERMRIHTVCGEMDDVKAHDITVINAGDKGKPFFHDRFILIKNIHEAVMVYSLSNSLNEKIKGFPIYIHKVESPIALSIGKYILDLAAGIYYDGHGTPVEFKPDIIWKKTIKIFQPTRKRRIFDKQNEPWDYPFWDVFWGSIFGIKNKHSLLALLKEKKIIHLKDDLWEWNRNVYQLLAEKLKNPKEIEIKEPVFEFITGLGEMIAGTQDAQKISTLFSQIFHEKDISLSDTKILDKILDYYKKNTMLTNTESDIHYRNLFNSNSLDFELITECKKILYYPGFTPGFNGLKYLLDQIILINPRVLIEWAAGQEGFIQFYSFILRYIGEHLPPGNTALIDTLLGAEKPVFKAIGCTYIIWQLTNQNIKKYDFSESCSLLLKNGYKEEDVLWILSISIQSGFKEKKANQELYIEHLNKLAGLYKNHLNDKQKKQLKKALSKPHLLMKFAEIIMDTYEEKDKVLFLWEECVVFVTKKLKQEDFYIYDKDFENVEIAARAFINIYGFEQIAPGFKRDFKDILHTHTSSLMRPFYWKKDYVNWSNSVEKALFILYFGYILLIIEYNVMNRINKELNRFMMKEIETMIYWNLKSFNDMTGQLHELIYLLTYYYAIFLPPESGEIIQKIIESPNIPGYMRLMFICMTNTLFSRYKLLIPELAHVFFEAEEPHINNVVLFLDTWIAVSYKNKFPDLEEIKKNITLSFRIYNDFPGEWKEYFSVIIPALIGSKKKQKKIKDNPQFSRLKTYQLLTGVKQ